MYKSRQMDLLNGTGFKPLDKLLDGETSDFMEKPRRSSLGDMKKSSSQPGLTGSRQGSKRSSEPSVGLAAANLILRGRSKEMPPRTPPDREPNSQPFRAFSKEGPPADGRVLQFALKYKLKHYEVKPIIVEIDKAIAANRGPDLSETQFETLLTKIFQCKEIKADVVKGAISMAFISGNLDTDRLIAWYVANMFTGVSSMLASAGALKSDELTYSLAKQHNITAVEVDKIKRWFDKYDADGSGVIDYQEFTDMMRDILNVKNKEDLSTERLYKFWQEIDEDGSQFVDFSEYLSWYLKYFYNEDTSGDVLSSATILAAYYDNLNPTMQRGKGSKEASGK